MMIKTPLGKSRASFSLLLSLLIFLPALNAKVAFGKTHVFWYNANANNYSLTACRPGPCLPKKAIVHEGMIASGSWHPTRNGFTAGFTLGLSYGSAKQVSHNMELVSGFIWSEDLNRIKSGRARSALVRIEYSDGWSRNAFCRSGAIKIRCGVVDFQGNIDAWSDAGLVPGDAVWVDKINAFSDSMGHRASTTKLQAEKMINIVAPAGRPAAKKPSRLDGQFFEIDVTDQVNWIIANQGQYAIVFLVPSGKPTAGKVATYATELSTDSNLGIAGSDYPWTKDGNTCHIVVEEDPSSPLKLKPARQALGEGKDTIPPSAVWTSPEPYSVIRINSVRLAIDARDNRGGSGIDKVVFFVTYLGWDGRFRSNVKIGIVEKFPYEIYWDCSKIPDQEYGKLQFSCTLHDKAGNKSIFGKHRWSSFSLDRNQNFKEAKTISLRRHRPIIIDGDLKEWARRDSIIFASNNNHVVLFTEWDRKYLYFGMNVADNSVISNFPPGSPNIRGLYEEDEVEIFLSPDYHRKEIMTRRDRQFLIAAAGMAYEVFRDRDTTWENLNPRFKSRPNVQGSINNESDKDTGYSIECAIEWKDLAIKPKGKLRMGMEILNCDKDIEGSGPHDGSWTGTTGSNLRNPSEWGTLVLEERFNYLGFAKWTCIIIALGIFSVAIKRYLSREKHELDLTRQQQIVKKAEDYIQGNYMKSSLNRDQIAEHLNISSAYLSEIFKKNAGKSLPDFLNEVRISKAKELLKSSEKRITEIAFEVGFGSLGHFARTFKSITAITPNEFRRNPQSARMNH